jgi:hypothetical protein
MASAEAACRWLCNPDSGVSCHYLVDEHGGIVQMVEEDLRAWHAGQSYWHGETDINSRSIGIEIHNRGHEADYPDFPDRQMEAVIALARDILGRHPSRLNGCSPIPTSRRGASSIRARSSTGGACTRPVSATGSSPSRSRSAADAGLGPGDAGEAVLALQRRSGGLRLRRAANRPLRWRDRIDRCRLPAPLPPGPRRRPRRPLDPSNAIRWNWASGTSLWRIWRRQGLPERSCMSRSSDWRASRRM